MYSVIPMPQVLWENGTLHYMFCFFPLVGAVIGTAVYGWLVLAAHFQLGLLLRAAVATAIPVLLSGGIHLDGFCDTSDALASKASKERMLEIMKDSHAGAFAVIGCAVYLLLYTGVMGELAGNPAAFLPVCGVFVISRSLSGLSVVRFRSAKPDGLVATFADGAAKKRVAAVLLGWLILCGALLMAVKPAAAAAMLCSAGICFFYYKGVAYRKFGGTTGDLAGWFLQLCELMQIIAIAIIVR